jgi:hypothetical protein
MGIELQKKKCTLKKFATISFTSVAMKMHTKGRSKIDKGFKKT